MLNRREFLTRTLKGLSLVAMSAMVPQFVSRTAAAATPGKDNILVVLEMTGGNDGLNTVIPYADDLYHKARPTLRQTKDVVIRLDDHVGLNSGCEASGRCGSMGSSRSCRGSGIRIRIVLTLRRWTSGSRPTRRKITTGWLGRAAAESGSRSGGVPILHVGSSRLPLAASGAPGGAVTLSDEHSFRLEMGAVRSPGRTPVAG